MSITAIPGWWFVNLRPRAELVAEFDGSVSVRALGEAKVWVNERPIGPEGATARTGDAIRLGPNRRLTILALLDSHAEKRKLGLLALPQRIDDLIERMGAITRQLKSYARKGGADLAPVNMGAAVHSALSMMEPQLKSRQVRINLAVPERAVMVMGDRVRIEQVIINLMRNAIDATQTVEMPQIDVFLSAGETATLTVRDNGHGIEDLTSLFEPFYTTKQPGDGVGLGLAISSGIVNDLGGRLTARNASAGGAVFEMQLPILSEDIEAAE